MMHLNKVLGTFAFGKAVGKLGGAQSDPGIFWWSKI